MDSRALADQIKKDVALRFHKWRESDCFVKGNGCSEPEPWFKFFYLNGKEVEFDS